MTKKEKFITWLKYSGACAEGLNLVERSKDFEDAYEKATRLQRRSPSNFFRAWLLNEIEEGSGEHTAFCNQCGVNTPQLNKVGRAKLFAFAKKEGWI